LIIDSSAILAIFFRETGAEDLLSTILEAEFAGIGAPTAAETGLVLTARLQRNATGSLLRFSKRPESRSFRSATFIGNARSAVRQGTASSRFEFRRLHDLRDRGSGVAASSLPRR
jgi:uncharacterized protein with PIN domain